MLGPIPTHRPLNEWESRINARWIIRDLELEARECSNRIASGPAFFDSHLANERRKQCILLAAHYRAYADRGAS